MNHADIFKGKFTRAVELERYLLAGRAIVTVKSKTSGERVTLKVMRKKEDAGRPVYGAPVFFRALVAPDNERDYTYLGALLPPSTWKPATDPQAPSYPTKTAAAKWIAGALAMDGLRQVLQKAEVWHEGRCGRCGRRLTVPESISTGFGPECAGRVS